MDQSRNRTLIVEDDDADLELLELAIKKTGNAARTAVVRDGESAVAYLEGTGEFADRERFPLPNLVLLDLGLPRKSGLEVLVWIREQPSLEKVAVVVLTGSHRTLNVHWAYEIGADLFLVKPIDPVLLKRVISADSRRRLRAIRKSIMEQIVSTDPIPAGEAGYE